MMDQKPTSNNAIYNHFFEHGEVRSDYAKECISLWSGWLGKDRLHLLDDVSEDEWSRFNQVLLSASRAFRMGVVDRGAETVEFPAQLESFLSGYQAYRRKDGSQFSQFVIPALDCVLTEEWDYTYILWHRDKGALEAIKPLLVDAMLEIFSD